MTTTKTTKPSSHKNAKATILIQKDPLKPPKHVKPPFSRQVFWWLAMIECGKALSDDALDAQKRTEIYETFLAINDEVYEGFYDKDLIWSQLETAYKATQSGLNNLYSKLCEQEGDSYLIRV
jgi:hypothetical protein